MQALLVLLAAGFVVPQLMAAMPNFDPLLMIMGVFAVLALLQRLGFELQQGEAPSAGGRGPREHRDEGRAGEESAEELLQEAERCQSQNNYKRVQELAKKATDLDPECPRAWELLATAQKWDGRRDEAAATVKRAQDIYEVKSDGLDRLAQELKRQEDPVALASEAAAKAEEFFGKRQYDMAAECYSKAIETLGGSAGVSDKALWLKLHKRRAECAQQLQDWSTVRKDATVVLEEEPSDASVLLQRAAANEAMERFKAALDDARKLLAMDPKSAAANRIVHNCQQALR
jgi:tetratricopeptide (TPR) repeat protein